MINTTGGKTFVGDLLISPPWSYRVARATMPGNGEPDRRLDGLLVVPRRVVEFAQIID